MFVIRSTWKLPPGVILGKTVVAQFVIEGQKRTLPRFDGVRA
jgi:hypothetical protein